MRRNLWYTPTMLTVKLEGYNSSLNLVTEVASGQGPYRTGQLLAQVNEVDPIVRTGPMWN